MRFVRQIIENSTGLICSLKKNRIIKIKSLSEKDVKLNLGCGLAVAKGWINIDGSLNAFISCWPVFALRVIYRFTGSNRYYTWEQFCDIIKGHVFVHHDLSYGIPFSDNTADYIYSSHFVEHMFKKEALNLFNESYRVLKKGGVMRIAVPDLAYAVSLYNSGEKVAMLEKYFFVDDNDSSFSRHKYMYDYEMLKTLLSDAGFKDITRCVYRKGRVPDVQSLDNRPEDTVFVEAKKT
jgi:predicted SAM-dependent methyltransferase